MKILNALLVTLLCVGMAAAQSSVTLEWDVPPTAPSSYRVYRSNTGGVYPLTPLGSVPGTVTTYTDSTVVLGGTYFYTVSAVLNTTESLKSNQVMVVIGPPVATLQRPTNLLAVCNAAGTQAVLSWNRDPNATGSHLRVQDQEVSAVDSSKHLAYVDNTTESTYTVTVPVGKTIIWWVHSTNAAGFGPNTTATFICLPPAPANLRIAIALPVGSILKRGTNPIRLEAENAVRLDLFINDDRRATSPSNLLGFNWKQNKKGSYTLRGQATDAAGTTIQTSKTVTIR